MPDDKIEISNLDTPDDQGKPSPLQRIVKFAGARFTSRTRTTFFALTLLIGGCTLIYLLLSYLHIPIIQAKHSPTPTAVSRITISDSTLQSASPNSLSVVNGVAYIGTQDGTLSARQADNGTAIWQTKTALPLLAPIVVDDTVYNISENSHNGHIDAFRASDGNLQWSYQTQLLAAQPVMVSGGIVYVCTQTGTIYALRASDGKMLWHFTVGTSTGVTPLRLETLLSISDGVTIIRTNNQILYFLRSQDGSQLWHYAVDLSTIPPVVDNGIAYINYHSLQAHRLSDGKLLWQYTAGNVQSYTIQRDLIYLNIEDRTVLSLNVQNGNQRWRFRADKPFDTLIAQNNTLFVKMLEGTVVALQDQTGSRLWQFNPPTQNGTFSLSDMKDGVLYLIMDDTSITFYALQLNNGHIHWKQSIHYIDHGYNFQVDNGFSYTRQINGQMNIWSNNDGHLIWHSPGSILIIGDLIEANGLVYLQQADESILALRLQDGKIAWRYPSAT
ncbi:MAG: PQQ-binding-like beta-propeller repeat protein [Ktedonobacteraceae bacterium]|nr:PQQ-binding-like beta-propeller repeat protein [Ktedonobacteraceae bacterium]